MSLLERKKPCGAPLVGVGVAQFLLSFGLTIPSGVIIGNCGDYYHVSFAIIPGLVLLATGAVTIAGYKCSTGKLLALGLINFLAIFAAGAGMASGAIGVRCELNRQGDGSCVAFAKEIYCQDWHANSTALAQHIANLETKSRKPGLALHGSVVACSAAEMLLCVAAAIIAIRAKSDAERKDEEPALAVVTVNIKKDNDQENKVLVSGTLDAAEAQVQQMSAKTIEAGRIAPPTEPEKAVATANIQNVNTVIAETNVQVGKTKAGGSRRNRGNSREQGQHSKSGKSARASPR